MLNNFSSKIVPFCDKSAYIYIYIYILEPDRPQLTLRCMRIACWIPKATKTHSEYVILITFPLQQWSHYTYVACLLVIEIGSI